MGFRLDQINPAQMGPAHRPKTIVGDAFTPGARVVTCTCGWEGVERDFMRHPGEEPEPVQPPSDEPTREELIGALIWMSGSDHFAPGGMAREGFEKIVLPVLDRIRRDG